MRVNKRKCRPYTSSDLDNPQPEEIFFRKTPSSHKINLSSGFRDAIHPYKYLYVDIEDSCVIFTPTDDEDGYKVLNCGDELRQRALTWCAAGNEIQIPERERIYGEKTEDGKIIFRIKENNNGEQ